MVRNSGASFLRRRSRQRHKNNMDREEEEEEEGAKEAVRQRSRSATKSVGGWRRSTIGSVCIVL